MRPLLPNRALLYLVLILLGGCAATRYQQRYSDSPSPDLTAAPLCGFTASARLMRLDPGEKCVTLVHSNQWLTRVPIRVEKGERYAFSVARDQFWYDASERVSSPVGAASHGIKSITNFLKRKPDSPWFALISATVAPGGQEDLELESHDVGRQTEMQTERAGQLAMYPNDASGPPLMRHLFYNNNHGQIWVRVERRDGIRQSSQP